LSGFFKESKNITTSRSINKAFEPDACPSFEAEEFGAGDDDEADLFRFFLARSASSNFLRKKIIKKLLKM
jgi:hypothetical protein